MFILGLLVAYVYHVECLMSPKDGELWFGDLMTWAWLQMQRPTICKQLPRPLSTLPTVPPSLSLSLRFLRAVRDGERKCECCVWQLHASLALPVCPRRIRLYIQRLCCQSSLLKPWDFGIFPIFSLVSLGLLARLCSERERCSVAWNKPNDAYVEGCSRGGRYGWNIILWYIKTLSRN